MNSCPSSQTSVILASLASCPSFFLTGHPAGVSFLHQTQMEQPHRVLNHSYNCKRPHPCNKSPVIYIFYWFCLSEQTLTDLAGKGAVRCTKFTSTSSAWNGSLMRSPTRKKVQGGLRREAAGYLGPFLHLSWQLGQVGGWAKPETHSHLTGEKKGSRPHSRHTKMVIVGEKGSGSWEGGVIGGQKQMSTITFLLSCFR